MTPEAYRRAVQRFADLWNDGIGPRHTAYAVAFEMFVGVFELESVRFAHDISRARMAR